VYNLRLSFELVFLLAMVDPLYLRIGWIKMQIVCICELTSDEDSPTSCRGGYNLRDPRIHLEETRAPQVAFQLKT
jgi:hypothetical protein